MKKSFIEKRLAAKAELKKEPIKKETKNPSAKGVQSIDNGGLVTTYISMAAAARYLLTPSELELPRLEIGKIAKKLSKEIGAAVKSGEPFMDFSWSKAD